MRFGFESPKHPSQLKWADEYGNIFIVTNFWVIQAERHSLLIETTQAIAVLGQLFGQQV